jgi:hypothetical protein
MKKAIPATANASTTPDHDQEDDNSEWYRDKPNRVLSGVIESLDDAKC